MYPSSPTDGQDYTTASPAPGIPGTVRRFDSTQGLWNIVGSSAPLGSTSLLSNAVGFGSADSTMTGETQFSYFSSPTNDGTCTLSIQGTKGAIVAVDNNDDGRGIDLRATDGTARIEFIAGSADTTCYFPIKAQGGYLEAKTGFQWWINNAASHDSLEAMRLTPDGNLQINDQSLGTSRLSVVGRSTLNGHVAVAGGGFGITADYTTVPSLHTGVATYVLETGSSFLSVSSLTADASGAVMAYQVGDHLYIRNESALSNTWWLVSGDPAAPDAVYACPKSDTTAYHFICWSIDGGLQQSWWSRVL